MVWVERDPKNHLTPTLRCVQEHLPLDQAAQNSIPPGPEHLQGWGSHNFSGCPFFILVEKPSLAALTATRWGEEEE